MATAALLTACVVLRGGGRGASAEAAADGGAPAAVRWERLPLPRGGTAEYNPDGDRQVFAVEFDPQGRVYVGNRYNGRGRDVVLRSADDGKSWEGVGPQEEWTLKQGPNDGGFRIHPLRPEWFYLGSENRGVYVSFDAGKTWSHPIPGWVEGGIGHGFTFAFHPTDPLRVYASGGVGVFRSDDGGRTWRDLKLPVSQTHWVAVDPVEPDRVYASQMWKIGDVLRSTDGGGTWKSAALGIPEGRVTPTGYFWRSAWQIHFHPKDHRTVYVTTAAGIFVSRNGGDSWGRLGPEPKTKVMSGMVILAVHPTDARTLAASESLGRVLLTRDGGKTWRDVTGGLPTGAMPHGRFGIRVCELRFDPRDPSLLWLARSDGLYRGRIPGR